MIQNPNDESINDFLKTSNGLKAMKSASQIALEKGTAEMTLDEINEEISAVRTGQSS